MASFRKTGKGWRAEISRQGVRKSKVFPTKREAQDWAMRQEQLILSGEVGKNSKTLFSDALLRYAREVSPSKRGERWEILRLNRIAKSDLGVKQMGVLGPEDFAKWRDARLLEVAPGSVAREMTLIRSVLSIAQREWGLLSGNPMEGVRKPKEPEARDRLPTADEMERLLHVAGDDYATETARAVLAFRFACETGMRAGEIVGLAWGDIDLDRRVARLARTKNGTARDVPLSKAAIEMLRCLDRDVDPVFRLDSRRLDVLALAKMVGHKNISQLMTYYDESAEDLAKRLD